MTTYKELRLKFLDKGYEDVFHWLVLPPPPYDPSRLIEPSIETFNEIVQSVYGKDWEYWSTWIDYQQYK